ncbi:MULTISPECIES: ThuA domain-containing protein [unclassified Streptomyces]|uniref:ThuA domain-containing protein n=1 Tax=unclassified Streptomyces TaxID=2593676 RepID=UPI001660AA3A|nr:MULTISPECIES: ThuA domain-containing protein [unclassified Streptomyces]MBD0708766.1 Crp/Fnr family transcriptional regulator [Streptomyces sp. CBMA291]MBD0714704.1 Crp/Fnr family transcriptional regulator [Streptomyces sp. CBMA370]
MPSADVLIYTRTAGYRHESIPDGAAALAELAAELGLTSEITDDPDVFTPGRLADRAAVALVSTTGNVLTPEGRAAFEAYLRGGGALLAVHAAANAEPDWPFYGELLGTRFAGHPEIQPGRVLVDDRAHPATAPLPERWQWTDEWYDFTAAPTGPVRVLARADETSYRGGTHGADHPLVWCRDIDRGRVFFTALGHAPETYRVPLFRAHLRGALEWLTSRAETAE